MLNDRFRVPDNTGATDRASDMAVVLAFREHITNISCR